MRLCSGLKGSGNGSVAGALRKSLLAPNAGELSSFKMALPGKIELAIEDTAAALRQAAVWIDKHPLLGASRVALTARLSADRCACGFGPGCANGELSAQLAARCERLLVSAGIGKAVAFSSERLKGQSHVEVHKAWMPRDWPRDKFDLIVLSEFLFYL